MMRRALLGDGTSTYAYDALSRVTSLTAGGQTHTNAYNGDGTLVSQVLGGVTTRYTQDLASPLSQALGGRPVSGIRYTANALSKANDDPWARRMTDVYSSPSSHTAFQQQIHYLWYNSSSVYQTQHSGR